MNPWAFLRTSSYVQELLEFGLSSRSFAILSSVKGFRQGDAVDIVLYTKEGG
jgi:hypothetical protein